MLKVDYYNLAEHWCCLILPPILGTHLLAFPPSRLAVLHLFGFHCGHGTPWEYIQLGGSRPHDAQHLEGENVQGPLQSLWGSIAPLPTFFFLDI